MQGREGRGRKKPGGHCHLPVKTVVAGPKDSAVELLRSNQALASFERPTDLQMCKLLSMEARHQESKLEYHSSGALYLAF